MGRKRPTTQAARRKATARDQPIPPLDPCSCRNRCPKCLYRCLGGHANYPNMHCCVELHQWTEPRE